LKKLKNSLNMSKGANDLNALVELLVSCQNPGDYANVAKERRYGPFVRACIQHGMPNTTALREVLPTLAPEAGNFIRCYLLGAQARADKVSNEFLAQANELLTEPPLACCVEAYSDVFRVFIAHARKNSENNTFGQYLPTIENAVRNLQQGKRQILTAAHCELLHTIWTQLEWSKFDHETALVELQPGIKLEEILRYYYYAGSIHFLHNRYNEAITAFNVVLNVPSDPNSSSLIAIDALKKYKLACLIHYGTVKSLPRSSGGYNGAPMNEYSDLETAFQNAVKGSNESLDACLAKHLDAFKADKNLGLVRRTRHAVARHRMHKLRKVYLAAPLSKITSIVMDPQAKDEDTKKLLEEMVNNKEIMVKIENRKEGTIVRFQDAVDLQAKAETIRCQVNTLSSRMLDMARRNELKAQEV